MSRLFTVLATTWPPAEVRRLGRWTLRRGEGGGNRVSCATLDDGDAGDAGDIAAAEAVMRGWGQRPIFMIRPGDDALDGGLVAVLADGPSPAALTVVVTDAQGVTLASAPLADVPGASDPQVAFDPTTRQALVTLTLPDDTGTGPANRIHAARFTCQ